MGFEVALRRGAATHRTGDPSLARIFRGCLCSSDFACFLPSFLPSAAFARRAKILSDLGSSNLDWAKSLRSFFSRYGCSVTSPWTWRFNGANDARISNMPSSSWFATNNKELQHSRREIWRNFSFTPSGLPVPESIVALLGMCPTASIAVLRPEVWPLSHHTSSCRCQLSRAKLSVMMQERRPARSNRKDPAPLFACPFCHQARVDLQHVVWSCAQRQDGEGRPPPAIPVCPLQKRLGWPRKRPPDKYDCQILEWMLFCRQKILQER